jgi:hypothetical protein
MEEELNELPAVETSQKKENIGENMSEEELTKAILDAQNKIKAEQTPQPEIVTKEPEAPSKDGQAEVPVNKAEEETTKEKQETIEPVKESAFDNLAKKKGYKSVDDLVKSYGEIEKKLHSQAQELSKLKKQDAYQPSENSQFDNPDLSSAQAYDNWLREQYQIDPIATASYIARLETEKSMEEIKERNYRADLKETVTRLSRNPDTMDFNEPEIQSEIQKIIETNPQKYLLHNRKIDPNELEPLYYQARGKLNKPSVKVVSRVNSQVPVEGVSKSPTQRVQNFNPATASEQELLNEIKNLQKSLM